MKLGMIGLEGHALGIVIHHSNLHFDYLGIILTTNLPDYSVGTTFF